MINVAPTPNPPIMTGQPTAQATEAESATLSGEVAIVLIALTQQAELISQIAQQILSSMIAICILQGKEVATGFTAAKGKQSELAEKP